VHLLNVGSAVLGSRSVVAPSIDCYHCLSSYQIYWCSTCLQEFCKFLAQHETNQRYLLAGMFNFADHSLYVITTQFKLR